MITPDPSDRPASRLPWTRSTCWTRDDLLDAVCSHFSHLKPLIFATFLKELQFCPQQLSILLHNTNVLFICLFIQFHLLINQLLHDKGLWVQCKVRWVPTIPAYLLIIPLCQFNKNLHHLPSPSCCWRFPPSLSFTLSVKGTQLIYFALLLHLLQLE